MSEGLQVIGAAVSVLIAQVDTVLPKEPNKTTQLLEWFNQIPLMGWGAAIFGICALVIAAITTPLVNLDKLVSLWPKYFGKTELSDETLSVLRQNLLKQMKTDVAKRLKYSLHNLIRVDLEQEEQLYRVGGLKEDLVKVKPKRTQAFQELIHRGLAVFKNSKIIAPVAPAEKTYSIFHRDDIGERLLILGEPGAGKTTELLTVAQRLVEAALEDDDKAIPLIFELSSWTPNTPILTWMGQQLQQIYGVSKKLAEPLARQWIQQTRILPLLDGLDELGQSNQIACIEALEAFLGQHPALSVIVCCRREEYEQGGQQLEELNGAIYLQAVGPQQIKQYLKDLGREQLWSDIQADPEILKLAQSPLFLTMLVIAYQNQPIRDTEALFNAYIYKQLHEPNNQGTYKPGKEKSPQQTLHYLGWLARQLKERKETEFLIENLQPSWFASGKQRRAYTLGLVLTGLVTGLVVGPLLSTLSTWYGNGGTLGRLWIDLFFMLFSRLSGKLSKRLFFGVTGALFGGLFGGLLGWLLNKSAIVPTEQLEWRINRKVNDVLPSGLLGGLMCGLLSMLLGGPISGPISVLYGVLLGGLVGGLRNEEINRKTVPNQGIKKSLRNMMFFGLVGGLLFGLFFGLFSGLFRRLFIGSFDGISDGGFVVLSGGLLSGLCGGLVPAIQHFILRLCLTKNGDIPWNYAQFLEHAARHRFIQRTGGRYRFVHDLLREHFSQMTPQQQALLAQKSDN